MTLQFLLSVTEKEDNKKLDLERPKHRLSDHFILQTKSSKPHIQIEGWTTTNYQYKPPWKIKQSDRFAFYRVAAAWLHVRVSFQMPF